MITNVSAVVFLAGGEKDLSQFDCSVKASVDDVGE